MKKSVSPSHRRLRGFTLAEVMIAMGIVASVMVALLGMIPLGVRSVREASNLTISGRIAQEVISNIQQSSWKDMENDYGSNKVKIFLFDHEGFLLSNKGSGSKDAVATYEARARVTDNPIEFGGTTYPKSTLRKVLIDVEYTPDGVKIPIKVGQSGGGNPNVHSYNFYVANQNKSDA